jgi:hypothetical protein
MDDDIQIHSEYFFYAAKLNESFQKTRGFRKRAVENVLHRRKHYSMNILPRDIDGKCKKRVHSIGEIENDRKFNLTHDGEKSVEKIF